MHDEFKEFRKAQKLNDIKQAIETNILYQDCGKNAEKLKAYQKEYTRLKKHLKL